jgi:hypothetical protein
MLTKSNVLSLGLACLTALSMSFSSTSFATCSDEIIDSEVKVGHENVEPTLVLGGGFTVMGALSSNPGFAAVGLSSVGAAGVSMSVEKYYALSEDETYAHNVLRQAAQKSASAELLSFIKFTQKEIGKDKKAVIPSEEEIIASLDYVNNNLSACRNAKGNFYKPKKQDLLSAVKSDLNL